MAGHSLALAGVSYLTPAGGWQYSYEGTMLPGVVSNDYIGGVGPAGFGGTPTGGSFVAGLDGTWFHDQGDKWDGTAPGDPLSTPGSTINPNDFSAANLLSGSQGTSPGGAGRFMDGGRDYLRIQDAGNPEFHGWVQGLDPTVNNPNPKPPHEPINTNRRVYFGHDMTPDFGGNPYDQLVLNNGITISFRVRIPNSGPLDDLYLETGTPAEVVPWIDPQVNPHGRGTLMYNGRGTLNVVQNNVASFNQDNLIGFSLVNSTDIAQYKDGGGTGSITTGSGSGGLIMNNLVGNVPSNSIDSTQPGTLNILEMSDEALTQWQEFWITIEDNGAAAGTHRVNVYRNGSLTPTTFNVTSAGAGNAAYANSQSAFLEMGISANAEWGSIDVDFFSYKLGVIAPTAAPVEDADFDNNNVVDGADFLIWQRGFGLAAGATNAQGDANGDLAVNGADFTLWKSKFGGPPATPVATGVPEPSGALLAAGAAIVAIARRRRSA